MWIENENYIGPCRRGGGKKRLFDRRRADLAGRDPSVAILPRQLQIEAMDLSTPANRRRFRLRLQAAIRLAKRTGLTVAAIPLETHIARIPEERLGEHAQAAAISRGLAEAAARLPAA